MDDKKPLYKIISYKQALKFSQTLYKYNNVIFFHSSNKHNEDVGRYSFIAIEPFKIWMVQEDQKQNIFDFLSNELKTFSSETISELPPFQGGLAGFISYDIGREIEHLPRIAKKEFAYPQVILGYYDTVISIDHLQRKSWIISTGFPEKSNKKRLKRADIRLRAIEKKIEKATSLLHSNTWPSIKQTDISSNFTRASYQRAVGKVKNYILNGDVFEVNLSQRFSCELPNDFHPFCLFEKISERNPAPFSAYMRFNRLSIISSSPERFIRVKNGFVETRPIKGTIRRAENPIEDANLAAILEASEKDRAENMMIVDLMRNDLSRVCLPNTIKVSKCCGLESYENVHHLVSVIEGKLTPNQDIASLLKATLPGGSITGAPKIRAMEIIDQLEPTRRGPYCGNAIYIGFNGTMDSSILIRTYVICNTMLTFQAGGAIVLDSNPIEEYEETLIKAKTLQETLLNPLIKNSEAYLLL